MLNHSLALRIASGTRPTINAEVVTIPESPGGWPSLKIGSPDRCVDATCGRGPSTVLGPSGLRIQDRVQRHLARGLQYPPRNVNGPGARRFNSSSQSQEISSHPRMRLDSCPCVAWIGSSYGHSERPPSNSMTVAFSQVWKWVVNGNGLPPGSSADRSAGRPSPCV